MKYLYCMDCGDHLWRLTDFRNCKECMRLAKMHTITTKCRKCKKPKKPDFNGLCDECREKIHRANLDAQKYK